MKKLIVTCLFLSSLGNYAQTVQNNATPKKNHGLSASVEKSGGTFYDGERKDSFIKEAEKSNIPHQKLDYLEGVKNGYYAIVAVYSNRNNLKKAVKKLQNKGFASGAIINPKNGMGYAYIGYYSNWREAIADCDSEFNGAYKEDVWILNIENDSPTDTVVPLESVTYEMLDASKTANNSNTKDPNNQKLLQKADLYFNKMWYAEAAELYEMALNKNKEGYNYDVLQKAGDAHYFNTNMERAYHWYNILYENYTDYMSADNIFKYAHSLKGTGKYARAKRLMRLYGNMKKDDGASIRTGNTDTGPFPNEVVLDNILEKPQSFDIKNLSINSKYSDFSPMFYNTDEVVFSSAKDSAFFNTRRYKWNEQPYLDLYVSKVNEESQDLKQALKFSRKINTKYHEASVTFSPDNTVMYFTRNNYGKKLKRDKNGVNHLKIYSSAKINGEWTEGTELPFNSDNYSIGHPALSADGKLLYFVSDMPGSIGETDIFVVDVLENGSFSEPRNLGPEINTAKKEMFPFVNNKKLYFSSDGHEGLGGLDIYEATMYEGGFKSVKNVGLPINSNMDDFSYIVNEETQKGFFASNRPGGKGDDDIYSFKRLVPDETEKNLNAIAGVVAELVTGDFMPKALVMLLDENNIKLKEMVTADDGRFVFEDLDSNTKYTLKTLRDQFFDNEQLVHTKENEIVSTTISMKNLKEMIAIENGIKKLKTDMIHFDFDKSTIRMDAAKELDKLVEVMNEYKDMVIKIESHTDAWGDNIYNKYLSNTRADSTRKYLISKGIAPDRIESAFGYGEEKPLNGCSDGVRCTKDQHKLNRRSEFIIVKM